MEEERYQILRSHELAWLFRLHILPPTFPYLDLIQMIRVIEMMSGVAVSDGTTRLGPKTGRNALPPRKRLMGGQRNGTRHKRARPEEVSQLLQ